MGAVTLERLHADIEAVKDELRRLRALIEQELADDLVADIEESGRRPREEMVSHEAMRAEFG